MTGGDVFDVVPQESTHSARSLAELRAGRLTGCRALAVVQRGAAREVPEAHSAADEVTTK